MLGDFCRPNKKNKKKYHPNTFPTKIIELDEDKIDNDKDNDIDIINEKVQLKDKKNNNSTGIHLNKKKINKNIDINLVENMNGNNNEVI